MHPLIVATIAGVAYAISGLEAPQPVMRFCRSACFRCSAGRARFAMGVTLAMRNVRSIPVEMTYIAPLEAGRAPPSGVGSCSAWPGTFAPVWVHAAMLMASLPSAN